jgi:hypothetical protein
VGAGEIGDIVSRHPTELQNGLAVVKKLTDEDLPRLNKMMAEAGGSIRNCGNGSSSDAGAARGQVIGI